MIMSNVFDVLTSRVTAWIVSRVRHEICVSHLILLFMLHGMFHYCVMVTVKRLIVFRPYHHKLLNIQIEFFDLN